MPPDPSPRGPRRPLLWPWLGLLAGLVSAAKAEVVINERQERYQFDASTRVSLSQQLAAHQQRRDDDGAPRSHGLTEVEIETKYELDSLDPSGCELRKLRVTVNLAVTLPEWDPAKLPESGLREEVARMLRGLAEHEAGHRRHVLETASAIERKLGDLPPAPTCKQARRAAERIVRRALVRLRAREFNYDLATGDGRTQGALLRLQEADNARRGRSRLR